MLYNEFNEYIYKEIRITPEIITQIIFFHYKEDYNLYEIKDIREKVLSFHIEHGGISNDSNIIS